MPEAQHAGRLLVVWAQPGARHRARHRGSPRGVERRAIPPPAGHARLGAVQVVGQIDRRLDVPGGQTVVEPLVPDTRLAPRTCGAICGSMPRCSQGLQLAQASARRMGRSGMGNDAFGRRLAPCLESSQGSAVLSLGSSQPGKHLSNDVVEATIATAEDQKQTVVLVGGSDVQPRCEALAARHQGVLNGAGNWTLTEVALAIREANALVSGDTATMHLGAALGVPTLAVWGCTRPSLGLAPWRPHPKATHPAPTACPSKAVYRNGDTRLPGPHGPQALRISIRGSRTSGPAFGGGGLTFVKQCLSLPQRAELPRQINRS